MTEWTRDTVQQAVLESLRPFCTGDEPILAAQNLQTDLGLDSVEVVELTTLLAKRFGLSSRAIQLDDVVTVAELAERLEQNLNLAVRS